jgi:hypothetical protein
VLLYNWSTPLCILEGGKEKGKEREGEEREGGEREEKRERKEEEEGREGGKERGGKRERAREEERNPLTLTLYLPLSGHVKKFLNLKIQNPKIHY